MATTTEFQHLQNDSTPVSQHVQRAEPITWRRVSTDYIFVVPGGVGNEEAGRGDREL